MNAETSDDSEAPSEGEVSSDDELEDPPSTKRPADDDATMRNRNTKKKKSALPCLRDLIRKKVLHVPMMRQACQEYDPDNDEHRMRLSVLHLACHYYFQVTQDEVTRSDDVVLLLIQSFPQDLRLSNDDDELPIHVLLRRAWEFGVSPSTKVVAAMMDHYPEGCIRWESEEGECPLQQAFFYGMEVAEILFGAFSRLPNDSKSNFNLDLSIQATNCIGERIVVNEAVARLVSATLPYIYKVKCSATEWTVEGWQILFQGLDRANRTDDNDFETFVLKKFPSAFVLDNGSVQQAFAQGISALKEFTCGSDGDGFSLFCNAMASVKLPSTLDLTLCRYEVQHPEELQQFLVSAAPSSIMLKRFTIHDQAWGELDDGEENCNGDGRVQSLRLVDCDISSATLRRWMRRLAKVSQLDSLYLCWDYLVDRKADITDALIILLQQQSPVRTITLDINSSITFDTERYYKAMVSTNNATLHRLDVTGEITNTDEQYLGQIQYRTLLNEYGRGRFLHNQAATLQDLFHRLSQAVQTPAYLRSPLELQNACYWLLREAPHLWSTCG